MTTPDANLLVYSINRDSPFHVAANAWLEQLLSSDEQVGFTWAALVAFIRLSTRPSIVPNPLSTETALDLVADWLRQPSVLILEPGPRHYELLRHLLISAGTAGNLASDAHVAAIALERDAEVHSADADFGRFPGLRWRNPLATGE